MSNGPDDAVQATSYSVLVVDDDTTIQAVFTAALTRAGYDVKTAGNGEDALDLVADVPVDLVLLDAGLPGISGHDVLRELRIRPETRRVPVIFVTGHGAIDDRVRGLSAGATDYLVKPVDLEELVARVGAQLRHQATWLSAIDDLERRLDAIVLLRRVRRSENPEATAQAICQELMNLDPVRGAAILTVHSSGDIVPIATSGELEPPFPVGLHLPDHVARMLMARLLRGPWVDTGYPSEPGILAGDITGPVAVAPLRGNHRPVGAIMLAGPPDPQRSGTLLSAAIDFSVVVGALINPELERQEVIDEARTRLRELLQAKKFHPVYQPVVDLGSGEPVGYEGLIRWDDGVRPDIRFNEATMLGIGPEVEQITLAAIVEGATHLSPALWLSVNVSPSIVTSGELAQVLPRTDRQLVVEITEHEPIEDHDLLADVLAELPDVQFAVDDAGAGYASLQTVLQQRPQIVKLDIMWTRRIETDPARQALAGGLAAFTKALGCRLVAEGIETQAELDTLIDLGVPLGQGYLFGQPQPAP